MDKDKIEIIDAHENNLKHVNVEIPKGRLVVLAGVSGSGTGTGSITPGGGSSSGSGSSSGGGSDDEPGGDDH